MSHVRRTEHANQNQTTRLQDGLPSIVPKGRTQTLFDRLQQGSTRLIRPIQPAHRHGQTRVTHTQHPQERKGRQGTQVLHPTERQENDRRQGDQDFSPHGRSQERAKGIGQDHTVSQTSHGRFERRTPGRNPARAFADGATPGFSIRLGTCISTDFANDGETVTRQDADQRNQGQGPCHGGRSVAKGGNAGRQTQDTDSDNRFDEIEDFTGDGSVSATDDEGLVALGNAGHAGEGLFLGGGGAAAADGQSGVVPTLKGSDYLAGCQQETEDAASELQFGGFVLIMNAAN